MVWFNESRASALFTIGVLAPGCSTIDDGGHGDGPHSGGGGTSDPWGGAADGVSADGTAGDPPDGPEYRHRCQPGPEGTESFQGWQITCNASSSSRTFGNPTDSTYVEVQDLVGPFGSICCEGSSPVEVADEDCQILCMEHVCEAARVQHVAWALDVSNDGMGGDCLDTTSNCGFDLEACMLGTPHEQVAQPGALFSYLLHAECTAAHDQGLSSWGTFGDHWDWIELPNIPGNDTAPVCAPAPPPEPGPPEGAPEMEIEEEPGTSVTLHWAVAGGPSGTEQSLDADVDLAYSVDPCAAGDCISISRLEITIPDGVHQGYSLTNLRLSLEEATPRVPLSASGSFVLGPRMVHATASAMVEGVPLVITGYNTGRVSGVALPRANTMTLNSLTFGFDDGVVQAALELNVNGTFVRHAPDAVIKLVDAPADCATPVTFEAATVDLDGDSLSHMWWVPPWLLGTGTLLEASLPPGLYRVYLTSIDASGRSDSTALTHVRSCR